MGTPTPHSTRVRRFRVVVPALVAVMAVAACGPEIDEEFPPGDPTLGGSAAEPLQIVETDTTNYVLWGLLAAALIAAGVLLVSVERWERQRARSADG